jgi:tRNA pseudouridine13 synthase
MQVLKAEKIIGIENFFTPFEGTGGKLRTIPEDFIVNEISNYPPENENGKFVIADVKTYNYETNVLIRDISNRLHISRMRLGFAGTKDKRAITSRLMSFYNISTEELSNIKINDVKICNIYRSNKPVKIGNLIGNKFEINIRNIDNNIKSSNIKKIYSYIEKTRGFPNFYGIQRFGIIRPVTHIVGRYIVKDDFEKAVMSYIANPIKGEDEEAYILRKELQKSHDYASALNSYPNYLNYEKAILNKLVTNGDDFIGALKELPKNLLTMFINGYQSYLFNQVLSERIRRGLPINKAVLGDIILPIRKGVMDKTGILVNKRNIDKINKQIKKSRAVVSGILIGSDTQIAEGEMGEIENKIIEKEKINPKDFIIPDIPFISSYGSRRPLISFIKEFNYKLRDDEINEGKKALLLGFKLEKGCYATSLLREFMKADDIRCY